MTVAPPVPPPMGPGVQPPFPAPPTEGRGRRIGLGLGIGGAVLVLFCGGGLAAGVGLVTAMGPALDEQAHKVVTEYFDAVQAKHYAQAYAQQCDEVKKSESEAQYAERVGANPIGGYSIGKLSLDVDLTIPVDLRYEDGRSTTAQVSLGQNTQTGQFQVCGVEE